MTDSVFDKLESDMDDDGGDNPASYWDPRQPGHEPILRGYLRKTAWAQAKFDTAPVLTIEMEDGRDVSVWCFHHVLKAELGNARPAPDTPIVISYGGTKTNAEGNQYHVFSVRCQDVLPGAGTFDSWMKNFKEARRPQEEAEAAKWEEKF